MRLVTFQKLDGGPREAGILGGEGDAARVLPLSPELGRPVFDLGALVQLPEVEGAPLSALFARLAPLEARAAAGEGIPLRDVRFLAPVPRPPKVTCIGVNYRDHAREMKKEPPAQPLVFSKSRTSVSGPTDAVLLGPGEEKVDYEVELAIIVGRPGWKIPRERVREHILGYTVACDVSDRGAQYGDGQWYRGKSRPTYCPLGPLLVTEGSIDPTNVRLTTRIFEGPEGAERTPLLLQDGTTADMIFDVDALVSYISSSIPLEAGEVILTGTPAGVGHGRTPPRYLAPGQRLTCEIEGIGALSLPIERAEPSAGRVGRGSPPPGQEP